MDPCGSEEKIRVAQWKQEEFQEEVEVLLEVSPLRRVIHEGENPFRFPRSTL